MLDVIVRALRHPIDYSGIYRTTDLSLKERIDEGNGVFSFIMTADRLSPWKAGQHAIFTLPGKKVAGKTWRLFSVASAPHEDVVRIGTNIGETPSSFKQHLLSLKPGEKIRMHGPYGELYLRSHINKVVGIAGGIGITPFRSIIADMAHEGDDTDLHLIYSAKAVHTYKNELENRKAKVPNLKITYTATSDEVNAELEKEVAESGNNTHYMLSGAPGMITALIEKLRSLGIKRRQICSDPFKGY